MGKRIDQIRLGSLRHSSSTPYVVIARWCLCSVEPYCGRWFC